MIYLEVGSPLTAHLSGSQYTPQELGQYAYYPGSHHTDMVVGQYAYCPGSKHTDRVSKRAVTYIRRKLARPSASLILRYVKLHINVGEQCEHPQLKNTSRVPFV